MCLPALDGPEAQMRHGSSGLVLRSVAIDALVLAALTPTSH